MIWTAVKWESRMILNAVRSSCVSSTRRGNDPDECICYLIDPVKLSILDFFPIAIIRHKYGGNWEPSKSISEEHTNTKGELSSIFTIVSTAHLEPRVALGTDISGCPAMMLDGNATRQPKLSLQQCKPLRKNIDSTAPRSCSWFIPGSDHISVHVK